MPRSGSPALRVTRRGRLAVTLAVAASLVGGAALVTDAISSAGPAPTDQGSAISDPRRPVDIDAAGAVSSPSAATTSGSPSPSDPLPVPEDVVTAAASGVLGAVPGFVGPTDGDGRVVRYRVLAEQGLAVDGAPVDVEEFARLVHGILTDGRGWEPIDAVRFARVDSEEVDVEVVLASPATTDALCAPLGTEGWLSCFNGSATVLNARRWFAGVASYGDDLVNYRRYLVSHEMGHYLGHQHVACPTPGEVAPVMVQQTKSLQGCLKGPWPSGAS